jgi:hypothetical protein
VQDERGLAAFDDLILLSVAVLGFSLFFASLAGAYALREDAARGDRLEAAADALLLSFLDDPRWTLGRGQIVRSTLENLTAEDVAGPAAGRAFRLTVWDVVTDGRWTFEAGEPRGDRRTATTGASLRSASVVPARVTATVWGP